MINLMPPQVKDAIRYATKNVHLIRITSLILLIGVAIAGMLLFGVSVISRDEHSLQTSVAQKKAQIELLQPIIDEAQDLADTIETIYTLINQEEKFSVLLQQIGSLMPRGSYLSSLSLTNDRSQPVQIIATTNSKETATTLQNNLINSTLFAGADIQSINANYDTYQRVKNYTVVIVTAYRDIDKLTAPSAVETETADEETSQ